MADKILSLPSDKNYKNTIGDFIKVLRDNEHAHVAGVFINGTNEDLLANDIYQLLLDKLEELCEYLDPECHIVTSLISRRVFSRTDKQKIDGEKTANNKVDQIINILSRKSNSSYQHFIDCLKEKDQEHIVYILSGGKEGHPPISKTDLQRIKDNDKKSSTLWTLLVHP